MKGFSLATYQNSRDSLMDYRNKGALRGEFIGFPMLHEYFTMSLPGVTDITGFPQSGKTEFWLECLLNMSRFKGWKHLLYVPDVGDKNEILSNLIHKLCGKTFDKRYENSNYISEAEADRQLQWITEHFFILIKDDLKAKITPYEFWEYAAQLKSEVIGGIHTATIDSWKDMKHNGHSFGRDDQYLEDVLSYRNAMADAHKMHLATIIHPTKTEADKDQKRRMPGPYDLKGGSEWYNNGRCMITVHRPDGFANAVDIVITKAKPKSVAKLGRVPLMFDTSRASFYWENEGQKVYASQNLIKPTGTMVFDNNNDDDVPF